MGSSPSPHATCSCTWLLWAPAMEARRVAKADADTGPLWISPLSRSASLAAPGCALRCYFRSSAVRL